MYVYGSDARQLYWSQLITNIESLLFVCVCVCHILKKTCVAAVYLMTIWYFICLRFEQCRTFLF